MYKEIIFHRISEPLAEMLIALFAEMAEGFEESDGLLKMIAREEKYDSDLVKEIAGQYKLSFSEHHVEQQNWNALWESNFEPVMVDDFVSVRAEFHQPASGVEYEIRINPKMSFGTGHHATTFLMLQRMRKTDLDGKSVFDFGTGTGILAILALKLGAESVLATDIDDWSIENARENFIINQTSRIELKKSPCADQQRTFDVILANINKNVLLASISDLKKQMKTESILVMSGVLVTDEADILQACEKEGMIQLDKSQKNNWLCVSFQRAK